MKKMFATFGYEDHNLHCWGDVDNENPNFVIVNGGDGSILASERHYPNIPKITVRDSKHGSKCMYQSHELPIVIDAIQSGKFTIIEETKLVAYCDGVTFHALNEIQIHNAPPQYAIRFTIEIDGNFTFASEIIGDGIIIATPFGATGYFKSAQRSLSAFLFHTDDIGVVLNNAHNLTREHAIKNWTTFKNSKPITIAITRGDGFLIADNNPFMKPITAGDKIIVTKDKGTAKFVKVEL